MRDSETASLGSGLDIAPRYNKEVERVRSIGSDRDTRDGTVWTGQKTDTRHSSASPSLDLEITYASLRLASLISWAALGLRLPTVRL